jgi:hypothetical protein
MKKIYLLAVLLTTSVPLLLMLDSFSAAEAATQGYPIKICYHNKVPFERVLPSESCDKLHMNIYDNIDPLTPPREHPDGDPSDCRIHHNIIFD